MFFNTYFSNVIFPQYNVDISQKPHVPYFLALSMFLAICHIFLGPYIERSRRVSMTAWIFSPDDNNFGEFMTPNLPQPYMFSKFPPEVGGVSISILFH